MKIKTKLLLFTVTLILIIGALTTAAFAANTASEPSLKIKSFNLSLENAVYMNFKVSAENVTNVNNVKILAWKSAPEAYVKGTEDLCLDVAYIEESTGYAVFRYDDLAAKQMTEMVYVCAYVAEGDGGVYSAPAKFSIAMYAYLKRAATNPDTDLVALMDQMLAYGAMAQNYFQYNTDFLATATLYQIDVKNGTLEDGFAKGWYQQNASFTLTADEPEEGYAFSHWENSAGESVGTTEILTLEAKQTDTYTAVYEEIPTYSEGLAYTLNAGGESYTVSGIGTCTDTDLRIPPTHEGKPVTGIGDNAFYCQTFMTVNIPDGVTSIGNYAFGGCYRLTSVTIGNSVTRIGGHAFWICENLTSIMIPDSVTTIYESAFYSCTSLTSVKIGNGVTYVGQNAFSGCKSLTSVYITDIAAWCEISFNNADANPLYYASNLYFNGDLVTELEIPDGVTSIRKYVFYSYNNLTSVKISNSVTSIGDSAFHGCISLMSVTIPNSVMSIEWNAFSFCISLTSITIPDSVTSISDHAFSNCDSLANIIVQEGNEIYHSQDNCLIETASNTLVLGCRNSVIPNYVTSIGDGSFFGCTSLTTITIPNSATSIGVSAFAYCTSLTSVTIPDSVEYIGAGAFQRCTSLASVTIGNGVTSIGNYAFNYCTGLTSVTIGNGVTSIGDEAFCCCSKLISVAFEENSKLTSIGRQAFGSCTSLTSITIPNSIMSIGDYAFYHCTSLTEIHYGGTEEEWGEITFGTNWDNGTGDYTVYYAVDYSEGLEYTLNADGESYRVSGIGTCTDTDILIPPTHEGKPVTGIGDRAFFELSPTMIIKSVNIPYGVTSIGDEAFVNCAALESITLPDSLTSIGQGVFTCCYALTSITIPDSVTSIGGDTFCACDSLITVEFSKNITSIADRLFSGCYALNNIIIPDSVTSIGEFVFANCEGLTSITIPDGVTSIGKSAFYGCVSLESVTIGTELMSIGERAFSFCNSLANIVVQEGNEFYHSNGNCLIETESKTLVVGCKNSVIPNSVMSIGKYAFYGCVNLTSITIPDSVTNIDKFAFDACHTLVEVINHSDLNITEDSFGNGTVVVVIHEGESKIDKVDDFLFYTYDDIPYLIGYVGNDTEITLPLTYKNEKYQVYDNAFHFYTKLTSITISDGVTSIGKFAFYGCINLISVIISDSVTSIGEGAFVHCENLISVTIPDSVTSIGDDAFATCTNLASVTISKNVTSIGEGAFEHCENLISVTIPDSVTIVEGYAFQGCINLTSVTIGNGVTSIRWSAFEFCNNISTVYYHGTAEEWSAIKIGSSNDPLKSAAVYYYTETAPAESGNFWHYVDGVPTKW